MCIRDRDDTDATLNIISILPSCHYRIYLYGRYHELVKKAGRTDTELEYRKWKIGGETSEKIQKFAVIYRKREKCLRKMESDAEAECIGYLKKSGLWDDLEAVSYTHLDVYKRQYKRLAALLELPVRLWKPKSDARRQYPENTSTLLQPVQAEECRAGH